jgi:NADPH-dependent 2,4-dienoyl-CoA reductase/sulfur reductase-like enzyme
VSTAPRHVAVVGAGVAGLTVMQELRRLGYAGRLTVVGAEPHLPYDRPVLSKQVLLGEWPVERAYLTTQGEWEALGIEEWHTEPAIELDAVRRVVRLRDGGTVEADAVVVASGCRPRIPGFAAGARGVRVLRSIDDCLRLRDALAEGPRVAVVGGGFLGLELASAARTMGAHVELVTRKPPLERVLPPELSAELRAMHEEQGTVVHCGFDVERLVAGAGDVDVLHLSNGEVIHAELVVAAVGVEPNLEWLRSSGLDISDGLECDDGGRVAAGIYCCGDVAHWWNPALGRRMRFEHRVPAVEQATVVARNLLGERASWTSLPFWWTDQAGGRLQGYGLTVSELEFTAHSGSIGERRFVGLYLDRGSVVGAVGFNSPKELRQARQLIGNL